MSDAVGGGGGGVVVIAVKFARYSRAPEWLLPNLFLELVVKILHAGFPHCLEFGKGVVFVFDGGGSGVGHNRSCG